MEIDESMADLLAEVRNQGGPDEVEVISSDDAEIVRSALGDALRQRHGLPNRAVEAMSLAALAAPFSQGVEDPEDQEGLTDVLARQHPETGGTDGVEAAEQQADDEPQDFEALTSEQQAEVRDRLERAETFGHRLPKHAESLREEAAQIVGVESADDIDISLD